MKIVRLSARNVKRLRAVEITPEGNLVVVGGKNGAGKSSVLDSIMYALGGKDAICAEPLRRGTKKGEVVVDLGEITVRRTFTSDGGGQVTIENTEGALFKSPQARLDNLVGRLSFDPLEFSRMDSKRQAETLRELVGLNFADLNAERDGVFAQRTDVNRDGKALRARYDAMPDRHQDVGDEEVASTAIIAELEQAQAVNAGNQVTRQKYDQANNDVERHRSALTHANELCARTADEIAVLQRRLKDEQLMAQRLGDELSVLIHAAAEAEVDAKAATDVDLAPFNERLAGVEAINRKVRENVARAALARELEAKRAESEKLSERIEAIDKAKRDAIGQAKFPVSGLSFDVDGGVTFGELPFDQASAAEQLRVSVAIGLALNPKLRVLLIRDGSLLDSDSMRMVAEMARAADAQLWLERVEGDGATVVIEDGVVAGAPAEVPAS